MKDILTAVNPDVSGIQLSKRGPDRDRLAIVGDGNRCAKPIAVRLPDDVLADLVPSGSAEIVSAAHQGEDPHVSWPIKCIKPRRAADYSHAVGSDMYRLCQTSLWLHFCRWSDQAAPCFPHRRQYDRL